MGSSARLVLAEKRKRLKGKTRRQGEALAQLMGYEIVRRCRFHGAAALAAENLSWVNDAHGSSRWNHSVQQGWVRRECQRAGTAFLTVSAKDSSRTCCHCGSKDVVQSSCKRTIRCKERGRELDCDRSAARVLSGRCMSQYRKYIAKVAFSRLRLRC